MHGNAAAHRPGGRSLSLIGLESLPCGCVASVYRAGSATVEVALVEAKGPHCVFWAHETGGVMRMRIAAHVHDE